MLMRWGWSRQSDRDCSIGPRGSVQSPNGRRRLTNVGEAPTSTQGPYLKRQRAL
jgi:hypothetical protein